MRSRSKDVRPLDERHCRHAARIGLATVVCFLALLALPALAQQTTVTYTYDEAGRLIGADYGPDGKIQYVYDAAGNLLARHEGLCSVICTATAPPSAPAGAAAQFSATATASSCDGAVTYDWGFGDGTPHSSEQSPTHTYQAAGAYTWRMTAAADDQECKRTGTIDVYEGACTPSATSLCLNGGRFSVDVVWETSDGSTGDGRAVPLTADTGYFWFFRDTNVELVLKVLDGTAVNGNFWVFYGALSNVGYTITVTDTATANSVTYTNPLGSFASVGDIEALPGGSAAAEPVLRAVEVPPSSFDLEGARLYTRLALMEDLSQLSRAASACTSDATTLCLNSSRFSVEVAWQTNDGRSGDGQAVTLTSDTGYFWFFNDANVELILKVLDGRSINGHFWVFYGALSNVGYQITVTDTDTSTVKVYDNPIGAFASVGDIQAFE